VVDAGVRTPVRENVPTVWDLRLKILTAQIAATAARSPRASTNRDNGPVKIRS
jgi:hypothetical protein